MTLHLSPKSTVNIYLFTDELWRPFINYTHVDSKQILNMDSQIKSTVNESLTLINVDKPSYWLNETIIMLS